MTSPPGRAHPGTGRRAPLTIVAAFIALGALYSVATPPYEAPDELQHHQYVKYLADHRRLPTIGRDPLPMEHEAAQPPLYYALGALLTAWIDTGPPENVARRNPHANIGDPAIPHNKNYVAHTPAESFPWRGPTLSLHLVRLFSVALGAGTVWLTYLLAQRVVYDSLPVALGAAAFVALTPQFLFISASVTNDALITFLSTLALYLAVRILREDAWPLRLALGLTLGAAAIAKLTGLGLLPVVGLSLLIGARRRRSIAFLLRSSVLVGLPALLVAGWWYRRNLRLYDDALAVDQALLTMTRRTLRLPDVLAEVDGLWLSSWAVFGQFNLVPPPYAFVPLYVVTLLALLGLPAFTAHLLSRQSTPALDRPTLALLALWGLVVLVLLARWTMVALGSQGRLLFPAIAVWAIASAAGIGALARPTRSAVPIALAVALLLPNAAALPFITIRPAYQPAVTIREPPSNPPLARFGDRIELVDARVERPRPGDPPLRHGDRARVALAWRATRPIDEMLSGFVQLHAGETMFAQRDSYPGGGTYPTRAWRVGVVAEEIVELPIARAPTAPLHANVYVGLYHRATMVRLPRLEGGDFHQVGTIPLAPDPGPTPGPVL